MDHTCRTREHWPALAGRADFSPLAYGAGRYGVSHRDARARSLVRHESGVALPSVRIALGVILAVLSAAPAGWSQQGPAPPTEPPVRVTASVIMGRTPAEFWAPSMPAGTRMVVSDGGVVVQTMPFANLLPWCPQSRVAEPSAGPADAPTKIVDRDWGYTYMPSSVVDLQKWVSGEVVSGGEFSIELKDDKPRSYLEPERDGTYRRAELAEEEGYAVTIRLARLQNGWAAELTLSLSSLEGGDVDPSIGALVGRPKLVRTTCTTIVPVGFDSATAVAWRPFVGLGHTVLRVPEGTGTHYSAHGDLPGSTISPVPSRRPALVLVLRTPAAEAMVGSVAPSVGTSSPEARTAPGAQGGWPPVGAPAVPTTVRPEWAAVPALPNARSPSVVADLRGWLGDALGADPLVEPTLLMPPVAGLGVPEGPIRQISLEGFALAVPIAGPEWNEINAAADAPAQVVRLLRRLHGAPEDMGDVRHLPRVITQMGTPARLTVRPECSRDAANAPEVGPVELRLTPLAGPDGAMFLTTECAAPAVALRAAEGEGHPAGVVSAVAVQTVACHIPLQDGKPALLRGLCVAQPPADGDSRPQTMRVLELFIVINPKVIPTLDWPER